MARYFQVSGAQGMSNVKLDSRGCATVQYTAKNVSAAPLDGQAVLVSLPQTSPPAGAVQKGWVKIDGSPQRHFDKDKEEVFVVRIAVPPKSPPGSYAFRLDVVSVARPDEGDSAPPVAFEVSAAVVPNGGGSKRWLLIVLVSVLVLAVGVVTTWLILRKPPMAPNSGSLQGIWINDNSQANLITKIFITQTGNQVSVQAFGKCGVSDCDWGVQKGSIFKGGATVAWNRGVVMITQSLNMDSTGHLHSLTTSVYTADVRRGSQFLGESFHRAQ